MRPGDRDTPVNMTNHAYFNLGGHASGSVLDTRIQILADSFTPTDADSIPTGEVLTVEGTPMDFRDFCKVGDRILLDGRLQSRICRLYRNADRHLYGLCRLFCHCLLHDLCRVSSFYLWSLQRVSVRISSFGHLLKSNFFNFNKVANLMEHTSDCRIVLLNYTTVCFVQTQRLNCSFMFGNCTDCGFHQCDFNFSHLSNPP